MSAQGNRVLLRVGVVCTLLIMMTMVVFIRSNVRLLQAQGKYSMDAVRKRPYGMFSPLPEPIRETGPSIEVVNRKHGDQQGQQGQPGTPGSGNASIWSTKPASDQSRVDALLARIISKDDLEAYDALDEESYDRNVGFTVLSSLLLPDFLSKAGDPNKALTITRACLHINEPSLMRAHDINLAKQVLDLYRANGKSVERSAIHCLHSMICHKFPGTPLDKGNDGGALFDHLRNQFIEANGPTIIKQSMLAHGGNAGHHDSQTAFKLLDMLLTTCDQGGADVKAAYQVLAPLMGKHEHDRLCHEHPTSFVCKGGKAPPALEPTSEGDEHQEVVLELGTQ